MLQSDRLRGAFFLPNTFFLPNMQLASQFCHLNGIGMPDSTMNPNNLNLEYNNQILTYRCRCNWCYTLVIILAFIFLMKNRRIFIKSWLHLWLVSYRCHAQQMVNLPNGYWYKNRDKLPWTLSLWTMLDKFKMDIKSYM